MFKGKSDVTEEKIKLAMEKSDEYAEADDEDIAAAAKKVYEKLQIINAEVLAWYEILLACVFMIVGYMAPIWLMQFQLALRQM